MNRFKLLALDIDGTVLNEKGELTARVRSAVARAKQAGMMVTLATGRNYRAALPVAEALEITAPLITHNGGLVISPVTGQVLLHRPLERSVAVQSVRILQRMGFTVYANRYSATEPDLFFEQSPAVPELTCMMGRRPEFTRQVFDLPGTVASIEPLKVLTIDRTEAIEAAAELLKLRVGGEFHVLVTTEHSGYSLLEVAPKGVSKATGLDRLTALNSVLPAEVMAFGDNWNDVEMLQFAGLGVAMGNAVDGLKSVADAVTASNQEDGVAVFLEQQTVHVA